LLVLAVNVIAVGLGRALRVLEVLVVTMDPSDTATNLPDLLPVLAVPRALVENGSLPEDEEEEDTERTAAPPRRTLSRLPGLVTGRSSSGICFEARHAWKGCFPKRPACTLPPYSML
jgi:hypothetical protein